MDNTNQISENTKNDLYKQIIDIMLSSLENETLTEDEAENASYFVLNHLDNAKNQHEVNAFLEELAKRWQCFSPLLTPIHNEKSKQEDQKNIENVTNQIKNLNNQ